MGSSAALQTGARSCLGHARSSHSPKPDQSVPPPRHAARQAKLRKPFEVSVLRRSPGSARRAVRSCAAPKPRAAHRSRRPGVALLGPSMFPTPPVPIGLPIGLPVPIGLPGPIGLSVETIAIALLLYYESHLWRWTVPGILPRAAVQREHRQHLGAPSLLVWTLVPSGREPTTKFSGKTALVETSSLAINAPPEHQHIIQVPACGSF